MALADELQALAAQSLASLNASHDYYAFSQNLWFVVPQTIDKGRRLRFRNRATGTSIENQELAKQVPMYLEDYLAASTFQHFVSLFEDHLFGLLRCWLLEYPHSLSRKQVEVGALLRTGNVRGVLQEVIDRELNELKYERLSDWFAYLNRLVNLGCPAAGEIDQLAEIKATRDILVHNNGVANAIYEAKAGKLARYRNGEKLEVPEPYHRASWELMRKVIQDLTNAALDRLRGK